MDPKEIRRIAMRLVRLASEIESQNGSRPLPRGGSQRREAIIREYLSSQPDTVYVDTVIKDLRNLGAFSRTTYSRDITPGVVRRITASGRTAIVRES